MVLLYDITMYLRLRHSAPRLMAQTWYSDDTELPACSVESLAGLLTVGTYRLCEDNRREGRILLYRLGTDEGVQTVHCHRVYSEDCEGVLDLKWSSHSSPKLAVAQSGGSVSLYSLAEDSASLVRSCQASVTSGLCLALEWSQDSSRLAVSDSQGAVTVLAVEGEVLTVLARIPAHSFEAWTTCFNKHNNNLFYSGGDDCVLKLHDLRQEHSVRTNRRSHRMGVTSMLTDRQDENRLWTGSYDEELRQWDVRNCKQEVESLPVGGGVWRIKQSPTTSSTLLLATMHDGFKTVTDMKIASEYREHDSLAYGADWVPGVVTQGKTLNIAATCSFYDHLLRVWSVS